MVDLNTEWGSRMLNLLQAKTVLMGEVGAGKTSLLNALRFGESRLAPSGPEGRTINIEVHSVDLFRDRNPTQPHSSKPDICLWVYDFGGHETYHFSQQLFLSKESIYIIIVDIAKYQPGDFSKRIRHWYKMVTSRVAAPIICVLASHVDECEDQSEAHRKCKEIEEKLKELEFDELSDIRKHMDHIKTLVTKREGKDPVQVFQAKSLEKPRARLEQHLNNRPKIYRTVHSASALTLQGIEEFKEFLSLVLEENQGSFQDPVVSKGWVELGLQISRQKTEKPWMSLHEFTGLCRENGICTKQETGQVLRYLQALGIVLYYNDHRSRSPLESYVFSSANLLLAIFGLVYNHNYHQDEIKYIWKDKAILRMDQGDFLKLISSLKNKGLIGEKLLLTFWASLGVTGQVFQSVLSLLDKFDLCYEIPVSRSAQINQDRYFVFPYLLSCRVPTESLVVWPQDNPDQQLEFGMHLDVFNTELPLGLFEKILVRCNEFLDYSISWKQGMVAFCNGGIDLVRLEVISQTNQTKPQNYWTLDGSNKRKPWNRHSYGSTNHRSGYKTALYKQTNGHKSESTNKKLDSDHVVVELSTRVQQGREERASHVMMLLVAVINRIILHHYPGTVALWYVLCPQCLRIRSGNQESTPARFPADNVILPKNKAHLIKCYQCNHGNMKLGQIFPQATDMQTNNDSSYMRNYLQAHSEHVTRHLVVRPTVRHLLKNGVITVTRAQEVISQPTSERQREAVYRMVVALDRKQMEELCYYLDRNGEADASNILAASLNPQQHQRPQRPQHYNKQVSQHQPQQREREQQLELEYQQLRKEQEKQELLEKKDFVRKQENVPTNAKNVTLGDKGQSLVIGKVHNSSTSNEQRHQQSLHNGRPRGNRNNNAIDEKDKPNSPAAVQNEASTATSSQGTNAQESEKVIIAKVVPIFYEFHGKAIPIDEWTEDKKTSKAEKKKTKKKKSKDKDKETPKKKAKDTDAVDGPVRAAAGHYEVDPSSTDTVRRPTRRLSEIATPVIEKFIEMTPKKPTEDDTKSIQDLTLADGLGNDLELNSPPEKVRWKDGRYVGTDYVKMHIQKFFRRKQISNRKEGDVNVQEVTTTETEVEEERMMGTDAKEITVRKKTTEETWEEFKTKNVESAESKDQETDTNSNGPGSLNSLFPEMKESDLEDELKSKGFNPKDGNKSDRFGNHRSPLQTSGKRDPSIKVPELKKELGPFNNKPPGTGPMARRLQRHHDTNMKPISSAKSMVEIRKHESRMKEPLKAVSMENMASKAMAGKQKEPLKVVVEGYSKAIPAKVLETKPDLTRTSLPDLQIKPLNKPMPLSSYKSREHSLDSNPSDVDVEAKPLSSKAPAIEKPKVQKAFSAEKLFTQLAKKPKDKVTSSDDTDADTTSEKATQPGNETTKQKSHEIVEIIESSSKYFHVSKITGVMSRGETMAPDGSSVPGDVLKKNKENKDLNYRTQYKTATPPRELSNNRTSMLKPRVAPSEKIQGKNTAPPTKLPTILNSSQTYKLRDQYSLSSRRSSGEDVIEKQSGMDERKLQNVRTITYSTQWVEPAEEKKKIGLEDQPLNSTNPRGKLDEPLGAGPHHSNSSNWKQDPLDIYEKVEDLIGPDPRYASPGNRIEEGVSEGRSSIPTRYFPDVRFQDSVQLGPGQGDRDLPARNPYLDISDENTKQGRQLYLNENNPDTDESKQEHQPALKKYESERNLPYWSKGLDSPLTPPPLHWSTVSLPVAPGGVQPAPSGYRQGGSNLNKWKEANLHESPRKKLFSNQDGNLETPSGSEPELPARRYLEHSISEPVVKGRPGYNQYGGHSGGFDDKSSVESYIGNSLMDEDDPRFFVRSVMDKAKYKIHDDSSGWVETDLDEPDANKATVRSIASDPVSFRNQNVSPQRAAPIGGPNKTDNLHSYGTGFDHIYENDNNGWWIETDLDSTRIQNPMPISQFTHSSQPATADLYEDLEPHVRLQADRTEPLFHSSPEKPLHSQQLQESKPPSNHKRRVHYEDEPSLKPEEMYQYDQNYSHQSLPNSQFNESDVPDFSPKFQGQSDYDIHNSSKNSGHSRSYEISPDMYYTHNFESTEPETDSFYPHRNPPSLQVGYPDQLDPNHQQGQQRNALHGDMPEYWERIPIEGQHSPRHQRESKDQIPYPEAGIGHQGEHPGHNDRYHFNEYEADHHRDRSRKYDDTDPYGNRADERIPVWNHDPRFLNVANREPVERIPSLNNSDPGFHELSFHSQPTPEPFMDRSMDQPPIDRVNQDDSRYHPMGDENPQIHGGNWNHPNPPQFDHQPQQHQPEGVDFHQERPNGNVDRERRREIPIEGIRFQQIEVHRTTASALSPANRANTSGNGGGIKANGRTKKKSREENDIYENLRPIENFWSDSSMERARKGRTDNDISERGMDVYGHERGWERGGEPIQGLVGRSRDSSGGTKAKVKERSMSYRYRPQSEHIEQHKDMIQGYLDEINKNVGASGAKHKKDSKHKHEKGHNHKSSKSKRHSDEGPPRWKHQFYSGFDESPHSGRHPHPQAHHPSGHHHHHQSQTLPRSLKFDSGYQHPRTEPHLQSRDSLQDPYTGTPESRNQRGKSSRRSKVNDKDVNAFFLSQV